jgi:hypothetical protein
MPVVATNGCAGFTTKTRLDTFLSRLDTICHNICCLIQEQYKVGNHPVFWQDGTIEDATMKAAVQANEPEDPDCYALVPMNLSRGGRCDGNTRLF